MTNKPTRSITDRMLDAFDAFATELELPLRDLITRTELTTMPLNSLDDIAILRCELNDDLRELELIAIFDRDSTFIRNIMLNSDSTLATII